MEQVTHERARAWLHEGRSRLHVEDQAELDRHLANCADCQGYAAHLAAFEPALTQALRARWDVVRPQAEPRFSERPPAVGKSPAVWAWLTSLILAGGLTLLAAMALAGPGLFERLGFAVGLTATMPAITTPASVSTSTIVLSTMAPAGTATVPASLPTAKRLTETPATSFSRAPVRAMLLRWITDQKSFVVRPIDPETLADLPGYVPIDLQHDAFPNALSPDGRRWAAVVWPGDPIIGGGVLHLIDTSTWRDIPTSVVLSDSVHNLVFSPDGSRLAVTEVWDHVGGGKESWGADLRIINVNQPDESNTVLFDLFSQQLAFSADGRQLVIYGTPFPNCDGSGCFATGAPRVMAFDVPTGQALWAQTLSKVKDGEYREPTSQNPTLVNYYTPGLTFSRDGRRLYIIHADADLFTRVDLSDGSVHTMTIARPVSWLDQLMSLTSATAYAKGEPAGGTDKYAVLSLDETRLYVTGWQRQVKLDANAPGGAQEINTALEPQVINPQTGSRLTQAEQALADETGMQLITSPDGRWLYLNRPTTRGDQGTPDPTLPGLKILDATTLKPIAQLEKGVTDMIVTFAPDGNMAYLAITDRQSGSVTLQALLTSSGQPVATRDTGPTGIVIVLPR